MCYRFVINEAALSVSFSFIDNREILEGPSTVLKLVDNRPASLVISPYTARLFSAT